MAKIQMWLQHIYKNFNYNGLRRIVIIDFEQILLLISGILISNFLETNFISEILLSELQNNVGVEFTLEFFKK